MPLNPEAPFAHAARTLDLDAVLDLVAGRCVNEAARAAVRALVPRTDAGSIAESLAEIDELRAFQQREGDVPIAATDHRDFVDALARRAAGPAPDALWRLAQSERAAADLRRRLEGRADDFARLAAMAVRIVPDAALVAAIEAAIDSDGAVRDQASPALARLRRQIRDARASLRAFSERLVGEYGDDVLATVLGSRHVLVVPRARVSRQDGLVHAASHSGGSLYYEPAKLVEQNNALETHVADERAEVARILEALADRVRAARERLLANADAVDAIDALRAKAVFGESFRCATPAASRDGRLRLVRARHPLLAHVLSAESRELVPLDITLEPDGRLMVISGPNAGGKTVALRTVGVCALMYQCGLQVPCEATSELPVFARVLVDIGDEQSMASSLSTFTSHLRHLDTMCRLADAETLCLIDEIGDGTDPDEGAALAVATLERLLGSRAAVIATTHFGRIKAFALATEGVSNASMAFEDAEGRPLYRLLEGVAGRSRGLDTARRTGFDTEIVARAASFLGAEAFKLDAVLSALESRTLSLEQAQARAEASESALRAEIAAYKEKAAAYDLTRRQAQKRALEEAESILVAARAEVERVVRTIRERQAQKPAIREARERLRERIDAVRDRLAPVAPEAPRLEAVAAGQWVAVSAAGSPAGRVIDVENGRATVEIDGKRIRLPVEKLYAASTPGAADSSEPAFTAIEAEPLASTSVDVRGEDREDALGAVQRFVDQAVLAGVQEITVIHGVGKGVLARAVREHLRGDPRVAAVRPGEPREGGDGVTIVRFQ